MTCTSEKKILNHRHSLAFTMHEFDRSPTFLIKHPFLKAHVWSYQNICYYDKEKKKTFLHSLTRTPFHGTSASCANHYEKENKLGIF